MWLRTMTATSLMRLKMARNILVDTSAIFAIVSTADRYHDQASRIYSEMIDQGDALLTNSYVLVESAALIHRRLGFAPLQQFFKSMHGVWDTIWIDHPIHEEIWRRMHSRGSSRLSLVDWSVIVNAENTRSAIFTFDSDFASEGLAVIPGEIPVS